MEDQRSGDDITSVVLAQVVLDRLKDRGDSIPRQVLTRIKDDPALRVIPVVVLTTSPREEDVIQTYQAGANTYIQKPAEFPRYRDLVRTLRQYWCDTALRPPHLPARG